MTPDESSLNESADDEDNYEMNDEGDYEVDDDYQNDRNSNKTSSKSKRVEVELPKIESTSMKPTANPATSATTTATPVKSVSTESTATPSHVTTVRMPAVRSETVPNGFRGKAESKRTKIDFANPKIKDSIDDRPDSYVTVTKSISGSLDNSKTPPTDDKKFESTYYTKSSTCGYFTFTCNVVYGSNGRSKICRPKAPADGKC